MGRSLVVACALWFVVNVVWADDPVRTCATLREYQAFDFARYERGYLEALHSPLPAIVECALRDMAAIKLAQPDLTCERTYRRISELAEGGSTPAVRYKAMLVRFIFDFPALFVDDREREFVNDHDLFAAVEARLHRSTLVLTR